jgi:hypothetical protein
VLAFGLGLVFGFTFDTSGPRVAAQPVPAGPPVAEPVPSEVGDTAVIRPPAQVAGEPARDEPPPR